MTRLTDEQITQKAREFGAATWDDKCSQDAILGGGFDHMGCVASARAAIIATLTEYAPDMLPRDPDDEELAAQYAAQMRNRPINVTCEDVMLRLIKHMKGEAK